MFVSRLPQHRPRYGASETYTYHTRFDRADGFARGDGGEALGNVGAVILTAGAAAAGADMDLGGRIRHATCEHKGKNSASTSPAQIQAYHGHIQASQISIAYGNRQPVLVLTVGPGGVEAAVRRPARIPARIRTKRRNIAGRGSSGSSGFWRGLRHANGSQRVLIHRPCPARAGAR